MGGAVALAPRNLLRLPCLERFFDECHAQVRQRPSFLVGDSFQFFMGQVIKPDRHDVQTLSGFFGHPQKLLESI
jgi:hypothetical protein